MKMENNKPPETSKGFKEDEDILENSLSEKNSKGPLSFLSGAITSSFFSWICFLLSKNIVIYFSTHSQKYTSAFAENIASAFKTLIIGMSFLATFTFGFIGIGLTLVFIRSLFDAKQLES